MAKLTTMARLCARIGLGACFAPQVGAEWMDARLTAYSPFCPHCTGKRRPDGIGANGARAIPGQTLAADPVLPFGTRIWINGQWWIVGDRGGRVRGNVLDLCLPSHQLARRFGVKMERVWVER